MTTPLTVSQLTFAIKNQLENNFRSCSLTGEISNFKPHSGGHLYFDIKDEGAKIPAVMFRGQKENISKMPKEGDSVIVTGSVTVYPPHGRYQFICQTLTLKGVGDLLLKYEKLKKKLYSLGWFKKELKKQLPLFPKKIGVVTSPTGAVIRDIIQVISRRVSGFHLLLYPVRVQGAGAAQEIANAIELLNQQKLVDVMIVGRGGGSLEDLWPFNEECVAKAIFESEIPVISAVGHETDIVLSDYVADVRAPTPSAAAEIVTEELMKQLETLKRNRQQLNYTLKHLMRRAKERLTRYATHPLFTSPYNLIGPPMQRLDELETLLNHKIKQMLELKKQSIMTYSKSLTALNPKKVLERGYSILFAQKTGSVIVSANQLEMDQTIRAVFKDGESLLTVKEKVISGR
ncbi:MAG: exodeoxyribonuclease VII large subunit [Chlamydiia bacterium]|nr:exodeoxyribonuclease VII large subunit [Chlamydiia bacterium]